MNKIKNKILLIFLISIFIFSIFSLKVNSLESSQILLPNGKGPYEGEKNIAYSIENLVDNLKRDYITIKKGENFIKFLTNGFSISFIGSSSQSPIVELQITFPKKLFAPGNVFKSVIINYELSFNLPSKSYVEIFYPQNNSFKILRGSLINYKFTDNVTTFGLLARQGYLEILIKVYAQGSDILNLNVDFIKVTQIMQRTYAVSTEHWIYLLDDLKSVLHKVTLPIKYDSQGYDDVILEIYYPVVFNLTKLVVNAREYNIKDWNVINKGNLTIISKNKPFGSSIDTKASLEFVSPQSIIRVETFPLINFKIPEKYINRSLFNFSLNTFIEGESLSLVAINVDIKYAEEGGIFMYYIIDPEGNVVYNRYFELRIEETKESPLGKVLVGLSNITLDFINGKSGVWTFQVISVTRYNIGINETKITVHSFSFIDYEIIKASNLEISGYFKTFINYENNSIWKGGYAILVDNYSNPTSYSINFKINNTIGISSISVRDKVSSLEELNFATLIILNNSTRENTLNEITMHFRVFDKYYSSKFSLLLNLLEYPTFKPFESRLYLIYFSLAPIKPFVTIQSLISGKSYNLTFPEIKENNPMSHPLRHRVYQIGFSMNGKSYFTGWLLYDPKSIIKGDLLGIYEVNMDNFGTASYNFTYKDLSYVKSYEIYALAYTNSYTYILGKVFSDKINITVKDYEPKIIKGREGDKKLITIIISSKNTTTMIKFDIKVYQKDNVIYKNEYVLLPNEEKEISFYIEIPKNSENNLLKIKSDALRMFIGYVEIEYEKDINDRITEIIPPVTGLTPFIPREYLLYFLIFLLIVIILSIYLIRKVFE